VSRNKNNDGSYAQGYWDGYRAFGAKVQALIKSKSATAATLQKMINEGVGSASPAVENEPAQDNPDEFFLTDIVGEDELSEPAAVPLRHQAAQQVTLSPAEKAKQSLRNLNFILYTASFLLVAAGALFVSSTSSAMIKLIGVCLIITVFYAAGYLIYTKVKRLRPAGLAFLGTGLALIPFAGFALQEFAHLTPATSWLITSAVGLVAYFAATILLQSQLVSYLTMAFVLSLVGSTTASGTSALVWQFVAMIGVSLLASVIAYFKPKLLPAIFSQPIERTGQLVTPVMLVASLLVFDQLRLTDYEVVFAVATLHYVVVWLQTRNINYEAVIRILSYVVLALILWNIFDGNVAIFGFALVLLMTFQYAYSLLMVYRPGRAVIERTWISILFVIQFAMMLLWMNSEHAALFTTIALLVIGATSYVTALRLRSVRVGLIGLSVSIALPFVVARDLFSVSLPWWVLTIWFFIAAVKALILYVRYRNRSSDLRVFMTGAYVIYAALALITAFADGSLTVIATTCFAVALFAVSASYIARAPYSQLCAPVLVLGGMIAVSSVLSISYVWQCVFVGGLTAVVLWSAAILHGRLRQPLRQLLMLISGQIAFLIIAGSMFGGDIEVNKLVVGLLLAATLGLLALRWFYKNTHPSLSAVFAYSYLFYIMVAFFVSIVISTGWIALVTGLGAIVFLVASYVERAPLMQIMTSILTVATLSIVTSLIGLPSEWYALFTFGISAVLFYAATGLHFAYKQPDRQIIMATTAQVTLFLIVIAGLSGHYVATLTSFVILLVWAVVSLALRWWCRDRSVQYSSLFTASYPVYYVGALLLTIPLSAIWGIIAFAVGGIIFWVASYAERTPAIIILGNAFISIALLYFWWWGNISPEWMILGVAWILSGLFYFGYWIFKGLHDEWRSQALLWSTWTILIYASIVQFFAASMELAVAATLIAFAITLGIEGARRRRDGVTEAAIYIAIFGTQRIVEQLWPQFNVVLYAHWWAVMVMLVALTARSYKRTRLMIAMGLITLSSGVYALTSGQEYQLLFLTEHLALLVVGALLSRSWAIWWGIIATALAILYFLRGYTFLLLGFLGLLLIAIVVWRLMSSSKAK
jgi:hypothetical protein